MELFTIHKYESPGNFLPARLAEQTGRRWQGAGPVFRAWGWGCALPAPALHLIFLLLIIPREAVFQRGLPSALPIPEWSRVASVPWLGRPWHSPSPGSHLLLPLPEVS